MSTYIQIQNRIADDFNRTDLTSQIKQNILLAVQAYKGERTWFNETMVSLSCTVSQSFITAPSDILEIDNLFLVTSGRAIELPRIDLEDIVSYRPTSNGRPTAFCYYQNRFELNRPADQAYGMPLYYVKELPALSADSDTNGWTTDCEDLIVFRAEKMIYANVIRDTEKAQNAAQLETGALTHVRSLRNKKTMTGYTEAHYL